MQVHCGSSAQAPDGGKGSLLPQEAATLRHRSEGGWSSPPERGMSCPIISICSFAVVAGGFFP